MKLHPCEIAQWQAPDRSWQRGRVLVTPDSCRVQQRFGGVLYALIQHAYSGTLEFVPADKLTTQPEEHPEK